MEPCVVDNALFQQRTLVGKAMSLNDEMRSV